MRRIGCDDSSFLEKTIDLWSSSMPSDAKHLIESIESGDLRAADELVPIVYDELRRLARTQLSHEAAGQSLQSADLVHEAYLRLVGHQDWQGQRHFMAAAAEAMRRILVERARRKRRVKHGGGYARIELHDATARIGTTPEELILISDLLDTLAQRHPLEAQIVKLHYFAGLSIKDAGQSLGLAGTTAHRCWQFARGWLRRAIRDTDSKPQEA
jgi:RNA polymerase sigma factor (TIGR02999 family)